MNEAVRQLQLALKQFGEDPGPIDGLYGRRTRDAVDLLLSGRVGPPEAADFAQVAQMLGIEVATIMAFWDVEAAGKGHDAKTRRPTILFEPHIFSDRTNGVHDADDLTAHGRLVADVSYPRWGDKPYPRTQAERWAQFHHAMALDPARAIESASWGAPQIMGFHWARLDHASALAFAATMARDEFAQLLQFAKVVRLFGLVDELQAKNWAAAARIYNGPGYRKNAYDTKLAAAYERRRAQLAA